MFAVMLSQPFAVFFQHSALAGFELRSDRDGVAQLAHKGVLRAQRLFQLIHALFECHRRAPFGVQFQLCILLLLTLRNVSGNGRWTGQAKYG